MKNMNHAWEMNESLLQSYRLIFSLSQAIFLLLGGVCLSSDRSVFLVIGIGSLSLLMIWYFWFPIVRARALLVDYYKIQTKFDFTGHQDFCETFEVYKNNSIKRELMNSAAGVKTNWRTTRAKLDLGLPVIYTMIWIFLFVEKLFF